MESVASNRAVLAYEYDEEAAFDGAQLIFAETNLDMRREHDIFIFINGNFAAFLSYVCNLNRAATRCPIRVVAPERVAAFDPGGSALTFFVDLRAKHRRDK